MAKRLSPQEARRRMQTGAALVCAYDDDAKFDANHLEGAMALSALTAQGERLPKDREIIFYCG